MRPDETRNTHGKITSVATLVSLFSPLIDQTARRGDKVDDWMKGVFQKTFTVDASSKRRRSIIDTRRLTNGHRISAVLPLLAIVQAQLTACSYQLVIVVIIVPFLTLETASHIGLKVFANSVPQFHSHKRVNPSSEAKYNLARSTTCWLRC